MFIVGHYSMVINKNVQKGLNNQIMHDTKPSPTCRLIVEAVEINEVLQLEKSFFSEEAYHYEHPFLAFDFKAIFDSYAFLDNPDFFRREYQYNHFIAFLKSIGSAHFYVSCPPYCGLYPLEVAVDCPFTTYKDAISYVLERTSYDWGKEIKESIGHPMRGAGFVIMPTVFMYDQTKQWAIVLKDSVTPIGIIGVKKNIDNSLKTTLSQVGFTSAVEVLERSPMTIHRDKKELFLSYGKTA